jgi:hypothetical protein
MRPKSEENIQARGRAVRAWLPGVVLAIGLAPSALAGAYTYTYAGNPLTLCSGPGCVTSPPYPVITGSFYTSIAARSQFTLWPYHASIVRDQRRHCGVDQYEQYPAGSRNSN